MKIIKIQIKTKSQRYPIFIGSNIIYSLDKILKKEKLNFNKCLIIADSKISKIKINKIAQSLKNKKIVIFYYKANEKNKDQKNINKILEVLLKNNLNRNDCILSIGGGITGDMSGYASSIYKRGLKFINIPTTLLAQVDSSIGGKTGINTKYGKNLIGTFYQPNLVITDVSFLKTLPKREIICGYGEILKHAIIANKKFFNYLEKNYSKILTLKSPFIEKAIFKSCLIKKNVVEKDEKEKNFRKTLNFGHTFAHAYEATKNFTNKLNHGEAVLLGIKTATKFSYKEKLINKNEMKLISNHLFYAKLPNKIVKFFSIKELEKILSFMIKDKKNSNNKINLILLKRIGKTILNRNYTQKYISAFLKKELNN